MRVALLCHSRQDKSSRALEEFPGCCAGLRGHVVWSGMPDDRPFDITLFGASSFVGVLTAQYLAGAKPGLRWALAGRNRDKLDAVVRDLPASTPAPQLLIANVDDAGSMRALAQSARVVLTTVGPYTHYGEPLVAACAELGTDYVDLTGEPEFFKRMIARYHGTAARSGARILHACGFDSIPHDLGALFTLQALRERLSPAERDSTPITIEGFVRTRAKISGGTWQSALQVLSETSSLPSSQPVQVDGRSVGRVPPRIHRRAELGQWALPAPTIDPDVVCHSASLLAEYGPQFRYGHYITFKNPAQIGAFLMGAGTVIALSKVGPTRALLSKLNPPGRGPSQEERDQSFFRVTFFGKAAGQRVQCRVSGGDPGYSETAKMMAETGLCLAFDRERTRACAGVLTPAFALGDVLTERLQRAGITFERMSD